jgi:integrase
MNAMLMNGKPTKKSREEEGHQEEGREEGELMSLQEVERKVESEPRRAGGKTKRGKTKDGRQKWLLRIFRGYDAGGKRIYYNETFIGLSGEADDRLIELLNNHKSGRPLRFRAKTFADFFNEWIEAIDDGERREGTIRDYRLTGTAHLVPAFGKMALTDITDDAVKRFYKDLRKEGYAPATISRFHVVLTSVFASAEDADLLLKNPMRKVKAPKLAKPKPVAMTGDQVRAFLDAAAAHPEGFMFTLAYFLGARPCEYLGLQWHDFDKKNSGITIQRSLKWREGREWYVEPPKTEKGLRSITLTPDITAGLEAQRRRQLEMRMKVGAANWPDHGFVFTDEIGEPITFGRARWLFRKILTDAGLPANFTLKVSRHSCASALLKAGVHPKIVSERLGHARISTTLDIYTATEEEQHRDASERLGAMFGIGKKG